MLLRVDAGENGTAMWIQQARLDELERQLRASS